jgi:hypothetical protein
MLRIVQADSTLQCVLPPGTGAVSSVSVLALDQRGSTPVAGLAYMPPSLSAILPEQWPTDLRETVFVVQGHGFGGPSLASDVQVRA